MIQQAAIAAFLFVFLSPLFPNHRKRPPKNWIPFFRCTPTKRPRRRSHRKDGRVVFKRAMAWPTWSRINPSPRKPFSTSLPFQTVYRFLPFTCSRARAGSRWKTISENTFLNCRLQQAHPYPAPAFACKRPAGSMGPVGTGWRQDDVFTTEQILKLLARQRTPLRSGYHLQLLQQRLYPLAEIVRRVSGRSG